MGPTTPLISLHLCMVVEFVRSRVGSWATAAEIAGATGMTSRTARDHADALVERGVFERAVVFPGRRYRYASASAANQRAFLDRIEEARKVFPPFTFG
jgi:DNA-binding MarR family transcriptional regulator